MGGYDYEDATGNELKVGVRVRLAPADAREPAEDELGEIVKISDPDGDIDDYGRPYGIPPLVTIRFDDGIEDSFRGQRHPGCAYFEYGPYVFDDVVVLPS